MAKFSKLQWALASSITKRAREAVRAAKKINAQTGIVYSFPTIPNREQLRKMDTEQARIILDDLSNIKSEQDLRVRNRGGGNFLTNYDVDKFRSDFIRNEERKSRLREKLDISATAGTMGTEQDVLTRPARLPNMRDLPEDFEKIRKRVERQSAYNYESEMNSIFRSNYFKGLETNLGPEYAAYIRELTASLSDEDFYVIAGSNIELEIQFVYMTAGEEIEAYKDRISDVWEESINYYLDKQEIGDNDG